MSNETREMFYIIDGIIRRSGAQSYKELCVAAKREELNGVRTRHLQANTLRLNHTATATFAAHWTLFLVYKWILKLN